MMRSLLLACLLLTLAAGADPTDADVLRLLNASRGADQKPLEAKQVRILHPADLPGVTLVGYLTGARPLLGSVVLDGKVVLPSQASGEVLAKLGWVQADPSQRVALARLWLEKAVLGFGETIVEKKPVGFGYDAPKFSPPKLEPGSDGGVRVETWICEGEHKGGINYRKSVYLFAPDGRLLHSKTLEIYEVIK